MTHPTFQKLKFASFRVQDAGILALDAKNLLLKEPQTTERDEMIVNCDSIMAYCDHAYKIIGKMIAKGPNDDSLPDDTIFIKIPLDV